jgi:hypothetical protein
MAGGDFGAFGGAPSGGFASSDFGAPGGAPGGAPSGDFGGFGAAAAAGMGGMGLGGLDVGGLGGFGGFGFGGMPSDIDESAMGFGPSQEQGQGGRGQAGSLAGFAPGSQVDLGQGVIGTVGLSSTGVMGIVGTNQDFAEPGTYSAVSPAAISNAMNYGSIVGPTETAVELGQSLATEAVNAKNNAALQVAQADLPAFGAMLADPGLSMSQIADIAHAAGVSISGPFGSFETAENPQDQPAPMSDPQIGITNFRPDLTGAFAGQLEGPDPGTTGGGFQTAGLGDVTAGLGPADTGAMDFGAVAQTEGPFGEPALSQDQQDQTDRGQQLAALTTGNVMLDATTTLPLEGEQFDFQSPQGITPTDQATPQEFLNEMLQFQGPAPTGPSQEPEAPVLFAPGDEAGRVGQQMADVGAIIPAAAANVEGGLPTGGLGGFETADRGDREGRGTQLAGLAPDAMSPVPYGTPAGAPGGVGAQTYAAASGENITPQNAAAPEEGGLAPQDTTEPTATDNLGAAGLGRAAPGPDVGMPFGGLSCCARRQRADQPGRSRFHSSRAHGLWKRASRWPL